MLHLRDVYVLVFLPAGGGATFAWRNWGWDSSGTVLTTPVRITAMKYLLNFTSVLFNVFLAVNYVKPLTDGLVNTNSI